MNDTSGTIGFPENPKHGDIFEYKTGLYFQYDGRYNSWVALRSNQSNIQTATTLQKGAMSSEDLQKLNRLVLPVPNSTITSEDCSNIFKAGVIGIYGGDKFVGVDGNVNLQNLDEFGDLIAEQFPFKIHQHTNGFDFTLDLESLVKELIKRNQIVLKGKVGDQGARGEQGDDGLDTVVAGPPGSRGPKGAAPACDLTIEEEVILNEARSDVNKALVNVRIKVNESDPTKYSLEFDRQEVGVENYSATKFDVKSGQSPWLLAVSSIGPGPQSVYHFDMDPLVNAIKEKYETELSNLKKQYENITAYWIQKMSDLFDEQKAALCCALEYCRSITKSTDLRQHMESVAASALPDAKIVVNNRNQGEEVSSTNLFPRLPDGSDLCGSGGGGGNGGGGNNGGGNNGGGNNGGGGEGGSNNGSNNGGGGNGGNGGGGEALSGTETLKGSASSKLIQQLPSEQTRSGLPAYFSDALQHQWTLNGAADNVLDDCEDSESVQFTLPSAKLGFNGGNLTEWLIFDNLEGSSSIPDNATITEITVTMKRNFTGSADNGVLGIDNYVQLFNNSEGPTTKKPCRSKGQFWTASLRGNYVSYTWKEEGNPSLQECFGGLTGADIKSPSFGFALFVDLNDASERLPRYKEDFIGTIDCMSMEVKWSVEDVGSSQSFQVQTLEDVGSSQSIQTQALSAESIGLWNIQVDPITQMGNSMATSVELPAGRYTAVITEMMTRKDGKFGLPIKIEYINGGRRSISFLNKGQYDSLKDARNAYEGLSLGFEHQGGDVKVYYPVMPSIDVAGKAEVAIKLTAKAANQPVIEQPIVQQAVQAEPQDNSIEFEVTADKVKWLSESWNAGLCCGMVVNIGGQDYIIVKRSVGDNKSCGGGATEDAFVKQTVDQLGDVPAIAWPTLDGNKFAPVVGKKLRFVYDPQMCEEVADLIDRKYYLKAKGNPSGPRHLSYQLSLVLFPKL